VTYWRKIRNSARLRFIKVNLSRIRITINAVTNI